MELIGKSPLSTTHTCIGNVRLMGFLVHFILRTFLFVSIVPIASWYTGVERVFLSSFMQLQRHALAARRLMALRPALLTQIKI
jgi:hypothetical protein